jgi:hypothetical protein
MLEPLSESKHRATVGLGGSNMVIVIIDNKAYEYSHKALLALLHDEVFVAAYLNGTVRILSPLTYVQIEALLDTVEVLC